MGKTALVGPCPSMTLKRNLVKRTVCLWSYWLWLGYFNPLATLFSLSIMGSRTYIWWHLFHNTKYSAIYSAITPKTSPRVQAIVYGWQQTHIRICYMELLCKWLMAARLFLLPPAFVDIWLLMITLRVYVHLTKASVSKGLCCPWILCMPWIQEATLRFLGSFSAGFASETETSSLKYCSFCHHPTWNHADVSVP